MGKKVGGSVPKLSRELTTVNSFAILPHLIMALKTGINGSPEKSRKKPGR